jgi:hypothetical protein
MTSIGQFSLFQRKNQWVSVRYTDPWQRFAGSHKIEELFLPIAMILTIQTEPWLVLGSSLFFNERTSG